MAKEDGQFKPGQSGNPNGRPKVIGHLRDLARAHTEDALRTLAEICTNADAPHSARVAAASAILDRGYGKPTQTIEANVSILDKLQPTELAALEAALSAIEEDTPGGDSAQTH